MVDVVERMPCGIYGCDAISIKRRWRHAVEMRRWPDEDGSTKDQTRQVVSEVRRRVSRCRCSFAN